jgi:hypothetical protein
MPKVEWLIQVDHEYVRVSTINIGICVPASGNTVDIPRFSIVTIEVVEFSIVEFQVGNPSNCVSFSVVPGRFPYNQIYGVSLTMKPDGFTRMITNSALCSESFSATPSI